MRAWARGGVPALALPRRRYAPLVADAGAHRRHDAAVLQPKACRARLGEAQDSVVRWVSRADIYVAASGTPEVA